MTLRKLEDGMTEGAIKALVQEMKTDITEETRKSLDERTANLERKLDEHRKEVIDTVESTDKKVDNMHDDVCLLVGNGKVEGMMQRSIRLQEENGAKHDQWHEEDLAYRDSVHQRFAVADEKVSHIDVRTVALEKKVDSGHRDLTQKIDGLKWLLSTTRVVVRTATGLMAATSRGKDIWTFSGVMVVMWVAAMQYIHASLPRTSRWMADHNRLVLGVGIALLICGNIGNLRRKQKDDDDEEVKLESGE